jgi:voltage-gated potassium channel
MRKLRNKVYHLLAPGPTDTVGRIIEYSLITLIFLNIVVILVESVKDFNDQYSGSFHWFEVFSVIIFSIEYVLRIWTCVENPKFKKRFGGRLKFATSFMAVIDLLSILPFYLSFLPIDLLILRIVRLFRLFRMLKIARYLLALNLIKEVFNERKEQFVLTFMLLLFLLVIVSTIMFFVEGPMQPDKFSSIPATMWWGIATLTTVGYGDMVPISTAGKIFGGMIAIIGIGLFALPAGILSSGLTDHMRGVKKTRKCPHCGGDIHD